MLREKGEGRKRKVLIENTRCGATIIVTYYVPGTRLRHDFHLRHPRRSIRPRPIHQGGGSRAGRRGAADDTIGFDRGTAFPVNGQGEVMV